MLLLLSVLGVLRGRDGCLRRSSQGGRQGFRVLRDFEAEIAIGSGTGGVMMRIRKRERWRDLLMGLLLLLLLQPAWGGAHVEERMGTECSGGEGGAQ